MAKPPPPIKSRTQVLEEITDFIKRHNAPMAHWYVGTAADARAEMFKVHGFKASDVGLYRTTSSDSDAASLAELLMKRGAKGSVSTKAGSTSIFVFKLALHTTPAFGT